MDAREKPFNTMTLDELDQANIARMGQVAAIKAEQRQINQLMTMRTAEQKVKKAADDAGVEVQILGPKSVETQEAMGTPGATQ